MNAANGLNNEDTRTAQKRPLKRITLRLILEDARSFNLPGATSRKVSLKLNQIDAKYKDLSSNQELSAGRHYFLVHANILMVRYQYFCQVLTALYSCAQSQCAV